MLTPLAKLVRHNSWANQAWAEALDTVAPDDEFLRRTLSHILRAEQAWFQRIGAEVVDADLWAPLSAIEFETMQARHTTVALRQLDGDIERIVAYQRLTGERYQSSIGDILIHVCTHGAHHRGQMASYASGLDLAAPKVDFLSGCIAHGW